MFRVPLTNFVFNLTRYCASVAPGRPRDPAPLGGQKLSQDMEKTGSSHVRGQVQSRIMYT